jgi:hypothetical protein
MSWTILLGRSVTAEAPSKAELDNLRSIVARSLTDAVAKGLSADARFVMAYDAARTLSLIWFGQRDTARERSEAITILFWPSKKLIRPSRLYQLTLMGVGSSEMAASMTSPVA